MSDVVHGDDGLARCAWATSAPELGPYHDSEWGRPVAYERRLYEMLCLEGFQAGLSWITILRKRPAFQEAFDAFDPGKVSRYTGRDINRLLADTRIVRNRAKITATITNARATLALRDEGTSLAAVMWKHRPAREHTLTKFSDLPATTPESKALSDELRRHGFAFVGPTTVYSAMQAVGVVNDHLRGCHWHAIVEKERGSFKAPA